MRYLLWFNYLYNFYRCSWVTAAIAAGGAILGGMMSNRANAKESQIDREWQRENAQNAHQYQVADMRAAGLNPILSATGGAGARASGGASIPGQQDVITPAVGSALAARRQSEDLKLIQAQTDKTREEEKLAYEGQQTARNTQTNLAWDTAQKERNVQQIEALTRNTDMDTLRKAEEIRTEAERAALVRAQRNAANAQAALTSHTARSAEVEADMDTSKAGKTLKWTNRTTEAAEGASSAVRSMINPFHGPARRQNRR